MKKEVEKKEEIKSSDRKVRVSHRFITALAIVSILGFLAIITKTLFGFDLTLYVESLLMFVIGIGLIIEAKVKKLKSISRGLTSNNITHLTTIVIGFIAIIAGIFSFPGIRIETPAFLAVKGIISIIAIIVIVIQTWVID